MIEIPSLRPETRYGMPPADQLLFNRTYIVGYSYLLRQAKWAMERIDPENRPILTDRRDFFRADLRIPPQFRADLADYRNSDHDRGHLVSSADRRASEISNSETFLLSNMSPQKGDFNRRIWRVLEEEVRYLAYDFVEVYAICGPVFFIDRKIQVIGDMANAADKNDVVIPIPHAYFKSVLAESVDGKLSLWSFLMENKRLSGPTTDYLVPTTDVERVAGLLLWDRLRGADLEKMKARKGSATKFNQSVARGRKASDDKEQRRGDLAEQLGLERRGKATEFLSENPKAAQFLLAIRQQPGE